MSHVEIIVRSIPTSQNLQRYIQKHFNKISRVSKKIITSKVVIDLIKNHSSKGKIYSVHVDLALPRKSIISCKKNQNVYLAVKEAFLAVSRLVAKHYNKTTMHTSKLGVHHNYLRPEFRLKEETIN